MTSTQIAAPHMGFDRFIPLDWAACALRIRAGVEGLETLETLIAETEPGEASKKQTRSVLKGLWLEPRADLIPFADRGAEILAEVDAPAVPALRWGMAIAAYPFFGKVAELIGRLTSIQGECSCAETRRRMAETHGERETAHRAANRVMQTQASWGALERIDKGRRVIRRPMMAIRDDTLVAWLVEAAIRSAGRPLSVTNLQSSPLLFPFSLDGPVALAVSDSPTLELHLGGSGPRPYRSGRPEATGAASSAAWIWASRSAASWEPGTA